MKGVKMIFSTLTILFLFSVVCCEEMTLNEIGELITNGMKKNVDPCKNFYTFVCGNWKSMWASKISWNVMEISKQYLIQKMKDVLESNDIDENNAELIMEKKYYETCMDTKYSLDEGSNFYVNIIKESDKFNLNWKSLAEYYAQKIGETFLFHIILDEKKEFSIVRPYMSKTNHVPYEMLDFQDIDRFFKIRFGIPYGSNNKFREPLLQFIKDINEIVNTGESDERYLVLGDVSKLQKTYEKNCQSLGPHSEINWLRLLQILAGSHGKLVRPAFKIYIDEDYLSQLCDIIGRTSKEIIYIYLHYNFEYDDEVMFFADMKAEMTSSERSEKCLNDLPITSGVNNEIVNSEEFQERRSTVMRMFNNLKSLLREEILNSWLEDSAKEVEVKDIEKIILKIINIIEVKFQFMLEAKLMSYDFEITPIGLENYINSKKAEIVNIFKFSLEKQKEESGTKRRKKRGIFLNAVYTATGNKVLLTPALLFTPFFHKDAPMAYNFANLGVLLGHELSHSIDTTSLTILYESLWIENNPYIAKIFDEKKSCLVNQYNDLNEDGTDTLNENYADVLGLKLAFKALRKAIDDDPSLGDLTLPGFEEFNANKLFFITYANQFCEKDEEHFMVIHAIDEARVIGPLQNLKGFAEAFHCTEGQFMNPVDKCDFWEPQFLS